MSKRLVSYREPYRAERSEMSWTLSDGAGPKTVWVRFRDAAGNVSGGYSDGIEYKPGGGGRVSVTVDRNPFNLRVKINLTANDPGNISKVAFYADDHKLGERTAAPYTWEWMPRVHLGVSNYYPNTFGNRRIKAVVTNKSGKTTEGITTVSQKPYLWLPLDGNPPVTAYFDLDPTSGKRDYKGGTHTYNRHTGVDYGVPQGTPVFNARDGIVVKTHNEPRTCNKFKEDCSKLPNYNACGTHVVIRHDTGDDGVEYQTVYCHLKFGSIRVSADTRSNQLTGRQRIAQSGNTGNSSGPHLHLGVKKANGKVIDPYDTGMVDR